ncbi:HAD family hydrolase [Paenibacillus hodogayensis]|uniref:HAD family hydrolase n=1 Tax=Paenibacillus hodogayensis TaxID=279208 RepID=A0ABV5W2P6_9BACL
MTRILRYKAILFDMDNTLLRSAIDFPGIKRDLFGLLAEEGILPRGFPAAEHTIATLIETARLTQKLTDELEAAVWDIVVKGERQGMHGAELEPFVADMLERLRGRAHLTVLTNNALEAALEALHRTGIASCFEHIAGREQMTALKPSPSGIVYLRSHYPHLEAGDWLAVGDSWIDGKAAEQAGIPFLAYNARMEELERRAVPTIGRIRSMRELDDYLY